MNISFSENILFFSSLCLLFYFLDKKFCWKNMHRKPIKSAQRLDRNQQTLNLKKKQRKKLSTAHCARQSAWAARNCSHRPSACAAAPGAAGHGPARGVARLHFRPSWPGGALGFQRGRWIQIDGPAPVSAKQKGHPRRAVGETLTISPPRASLTHRSSLTRPLGSGARATAGAASQGGAAIQGGALTRQSLLPSLPSPFSL